MEEENLTMNFEWRQVFQKQPLLTKEESPYLVVLDRNFDLCKMSVSWDVYNKHKDDSPYDLYKTTHPNSM